MRNTLNPCRRMLLSVVLLFLSGVVMASGFSDKFAGKVTKDPQAQEQIKNAADALESTVESAITKGKVTRGGSGSMMQLIQNSDTLICSAWIISFRQELQRLVIHDAPLEMIRAAQDLLGRVERACQGVLDPDTAAAATAPGTGSEAAPPPTETPSAGQPFTPRPGWTIVDEICARKCLAEAVAVSSANRNRHRAEENERKVREQQSAAERELAAERENLTKAEARLASSRKALDKREAFNKRAGGVTKGSSSDMLLSSARGNARSAQRDAELARRRVELKEQAAAQAREAAARATATRERAAQEAADAQAALDRCLRDCYRQAASAAGALSTGASGGASTGTAPGTSSGTSTSTGTTTNTSSGTTGGGFYNPAGE